MQLQKKCVLITGATSGIGKACALRFAHEGANLILCGRRADKLEALALGLHKECSVDIKLLVFDITNAAAVENALKDLSDHWQEIDILVNNAGIALGYDKIYEGNFADWQKMLDTNVMGVLYVSRYVVAEMVKRRLGHVINIGSISAHRVYAGGGVYCATKFAIRAITDTLKMEVHGTPIRVSLINPGLVKTEFFDVRFRGDQAKAEALFADLTPLQASDIADAVIYCATRPAHVNIKEINIMPTDQITK